ncbi:DUF6786 family protein [Chitinophaga sp. MM2321]|uniref:DUF6786 family protein n=1 Tax=Chitinophaga sp. MM2321 TaxID=3137178 RepID=UPI0032D59E64
MTGCKENSSDKAPVAITFGQDADFLHEHLEDVVVLQHANDSSQVLVSGDYQARVMTSTTGGRQGKSYGWINYDLIRSGKYNPHINAFGGEERIWLGPEGGQYALFFPPGAPFDFNNWQTPGLLDTAKFTQVNKTNSSVTYSKSDSLKNYAGTNFDITLTRRISLLDKSIFEKQAGITLPPGVSLVAYETENTLTNSGAAAWNEHTGLLSIWLLGMYRPSDQTVIAAPFKPLANAREYITDDYFGKISPEYLQVKDSVLLLKADGKSRGKIGLSPQVARPIAGSVDLNSGSITLISFSIADTGHYVNSKWEQQQAPYKGDVLNCYNDGPLADGTQMGPFYELESSSDARALQPGESIVYRQVTAHIEGDKTAMNQLAQSIWQLSLEQIANSFPAK